MACTVPCRTRSNPCTVTIFKFVCIHFRNNTTAGCIGVNCKITNRQVRQFFIEIVLNVHIQILNRQLNRVRQVCYACRKTALKVRKPCFDIVGILGKLCREISKASADFSLNISRPYLYISKTVLYFIPDL